MRRLGIDLPQTPVDAMALAVDLGAIRLRHGLFLHDRILPEFQQQAVLAMRDYLQSHIDRGRGIVSAWPRLARRRRARHQGRAAAARLI